KIAFSVFALSFHYYSISPRAYLRQARQTGRADVALARKHPARAYELFDAHSALSDTSRRGRSSAIGRLLGVPLVAGLRACAVAVSALRPTSVNAQQFLNKAFELEYRRGVREAERMP
ncbi:MAG: hypothetical protein ABI831_19575, partial [Betaproteobacteria bacterium]